MALVQKERLYYMSPAANIVMEVELASPTDLETLTSAIERAAKRHATLQSRAVMDASGLVTLAPSTPAPVSVLPIADADGLARARLEEAETPLEPEQGLWMRHRYGVAEGKPVWLVSMHHVAGDGLSMLYFIRDALAALKDPALEWKTGEFNLCDPKKLGGRSPLPLRLLVGGVSRGWTSEGHTYTPEDRRRAAQEYYSGRQLHMTSRALCGDALEAALVKCREHGVTLTAALCAAMLIADGAAREIALAASIRPEGFEEAANWATGITVKRVRLDTPFWQLADEIKRGMDAKLIDETKRNYLLKFLDLVPPTLMDAAYMSAFGGLEMKQAAGMCRLLGFSKEPAGVSMTNLLRAPIADGVAAIRFYPPLVPNVRRLAGVVTVGDRLELTLQGFDAAADCEAYADKVHEALTEAL